MNLSLLVADHVAGFPEDAIPAATRHATRRALLDALGVMLGATGSSGDALPYRRQALEGTGPSRLLGSEDRTGPALAALANGALAHALDFGDTFDAGPAHPSAALVPALLAICDARPDLTVHQLVTALTLGSDLACRLSIAPQQPFEERGWYPPPLVNLIAAAAACARLMGHDADGVRHAMGLAMMQAAFPGEIKYDTGSPMRGVREGFAARAGVEAACLASHGARAFDDPLAGKSGFFAVYAGGVARDRLLDGLGSVFLGDQLSFKPWPACRGTHAYIEAALALRPGLPLDAIERIEAEIGPVQEMLIRPQQLKAAPASPIQARFSIPFTVAAALVDGAVTLDSFAAERIADPALLAVAAKVFERRNPDWGREHAASGSLDILLSDGTSLTHQVPQAAGHPDRPMSDDALLDKFVACAQVSSLSLDADRCRGLALNILNGDGRQSAAALFD